MIAVIILLFFFPSYCSAEEDSRKRIEALEERIEELEGRINSEQEERSRLIISGEGKMRLRSVSSSKKEIIGAFGEILKEGWSLKERLDISLRFRPTNFLSAIGKIRISNEAPRETGQGPEYISGIVPWATWALDLDKEKTKATLGSYEVSFTPLTLMRWDFEDNPKGQITGGGVSCGCTAEVAGLSPDSLEDLEPKPEIIFEGAKIMQVVGENFDLIGIFALPQIAKEDKTYQQYLWGIRAKGFIYHPDSFSFKSVGISYLEIEDDRYSVGGTRYNPVGNKVLGGDFNLPMGKVLTFFGEWVKSRFNSNLLLPTTKEKEGEGLIVGMMVAYPANLRTTLSYLKMQPEYNNLYDAISYNGNRVGYRLSSIYEPEDKKIVASLFYKHLKEIDPTIDDRVTTLHDAISSFTIANIGLSFQFMKKLALYGGYDYRLNMREDDKDTIWDEMIENKKHTKTLALTYSLDEQKSFTLQNRFITYQDNKDTNNNYKAQIISLETSLKF